MTRTASSLLPTFLILLLAAGCGDDAAPSDAGSDAAVDTGPIHMVFELGSERGFYDEPFPLETRRLATGAPDVTGVPNPQRSDLIPIFVEVVSDRDGFSPSGPVWMRMTGPLDAAAFPTPEESRDSASPVVLVDIDPDSPERGQRTPVLVEQRTEGDGYRPAHLLSVLPVPGFALEESTLYAVVVRDAVGSGDPGRPLEVDPTLLDLLSGRTPVGEGGAELAAAFGPLRDWLAEEAVAPETVVAATVFRTGDVTSDFFRWAEHAGGLPARAPSGDLTRLFEMPEYCAYAGTWEAPQYQDGTPPFESEGGRFVLDGAGLPVEQRTETAPFVIAVPKGAMPAAGFPLVFYVNGTGGLARQILDRGTNTATSPPPPGTGPAQKLARRGWGASGMAGPLSPERIGAEASVDGFVMYNFLNPAAMRDNFAQAIIEHVLFRRLLLGLRIDTSDCPGVDASAAADGMARYDPEHLVAMGQSLGSYLAGMLAAMDAGFEGAILTGAGGSWIEFAFGPTDPFDLEQVVRILIALPSTGSFDRTHPAIALFDLGVGPADNLHYVDQIWREPRPGHDPVPVLIIEGYDDDNIPENLQRGLVAALGADLVGPEAGPEGSHILETIRLAGGAQRDGPVRDNRMSPAGPITAGVVRYEPDRPFGGHYVTFQLEAPQHQYGCFVQTLYDTGVPTIVAGAGVDDPCD